MELYTTFSRKRLQCLSEICEEMSESEDVETILDDNFCRYLFIIKNFNPDTSTECYSVASDQLILGTENKCSRWQLAISSKDEREPTGDFISLYLFSLNHENYHMKARFGILDENSKERNVKTVNGIIYARQGLGFTHFISKEVLFYSKLLKKGVLTIFCELKINEQTKFILPENKLKSALKLKQILQSEFFDVTIKAQGEEVRAHKLILAECSSVFHELLKENDALEDGLKNSIEVDMEPELIKDIINFIYKDEIPHLKLKTKVLLVAAKKYRVKRLEKLCEKSLYENLSTENAINTFIFADLHEQMELKVETLEFIERNICEIIEIDWENFVTKHPKLFNEVFKRIMENFEKSLSELYQYNIESDQQPEDELEKPLSNDEICKDFEKMFSTKKYSDVIFEIEGNHLNAHKIILCGRSSVFEELFAQDINENVIKIEDFDFLTFQELLRYIYCGKIDDLKEVAINLLKAADKYNLTKLKEICENCLKQNMDLCNVSKILVVADLHKCPELKEDSIAFIGRNISKVTKTTEWEEFVLYKPEILNEIFIKWILEFSCTSNKTV